MSNLIAEGFATYGADDTSFEVMRAALLSGAWAEMPSTPQITTLPWAPQDSTLYFKGNFAASPWSFTGNKARRVLPVFDDDIMLCARVATAELPTTADLACIFGWQGPSGDRLCFLRITSSGALELIDSFGSPTTVLLSTSGPVIVAQETAYIETQLNTTTGSFTCRVNGTTVMTATGLPILTQNIATFTILSRNNTSAGGPDLYITDLIARDTNNGVNDELVGDRRIATLLVNRDDEDHQGWLARPLHCYGTGILQTLGNASLVSAATSTDFDLGDGDYTIEGTFRFQALPTGSNKAVLFGRWSEDANNRSYQLYIGGPSLESGQLVFRSSTDGTAATVEETLKWPWEPDIGTYYHIALVRAAGTLLLFIDGVQQGLGIADVRDYFDAASVTSVMGQAITNGNTGVSGTGFSGWMDEFRFTKGVARYTANFAPPTEAFPRGDDDPYWDDVKWLSGWDSGIFDESPVARTLKATSYTGAFAVSITPNDGEFNYQVLAKNTPPLDYTFLEAALVNATGTLTQSSLPTATKTVTVGTTDGSTPAVYKWVTVLADAYDVLIGADIGESVDNLVNAITGGPGSGTVYDSDTVANFDVSAELLPSNQMLVTANLAGSDGNSIATTTDDPNGAWGDTTLTGGADIPGYSQFGLERPPNKTTIIDSATMVSRAWKSDAGPATYKQSFVGPGGAVADGAAHPLSTAPTYYFDTLEADPDTSGALTPVTLVGGLVRLNRTQ